MSAKRMMSAVAVLASMTLVSAVCAAPASALSDVSVDALADASTDPFKTQTISDDTAADAMPDNPDAALPDQVSAAIPDDATVVSEDHAVTADGELKNITTGETVTDPALVGTQDSQPDPLAKTDGESFIPVQADEVKQKVAANGGDANAGGLMRRPPQTRLILSPSSPGLMIRVTLNSPISPIPPPRRILRVLLIPAKPQVTLRTVQLLRMVRPRPLPRVQCDLPHCRTMNMALTGAPTTVPQRFSTRQTICLSSRPKV
ncbi:hypothetical protein BBM1340_00220 [Bifidobacterium breve MCC 1340]|nr:hypothetical protein BBM1340_00220 [Bifidobacterium breve MCC 1340]